MLCCYVTFSLINHAHMCRTVVKLFEVPQYTILKSHLSKKVEFPVVSMVQSVTETENSPELSNMMIAHTALAFS